MGPYQSNMSSAQSEARTNFKLILKLGWKNSEAPEVPQEVHGNNVPKETSSLQMHGSSKDGTRQCGRRSGRLTASINNEKKKKKPTLSLP